MTLIDIDSAARALADARRAGALTTPFAPGVLGDVARAWKVQAAAVAALGWRVVGAKIGASSVEAQRIIGCDGPFHGPVFAERLWDGDARITLPKGFAGVECEFAFRLNADIESRDAGWTRESIAAAVASAHPALELIGRREATASLSGVENAIADFGLNVGLVVGPAIDDWRQVDFAKAVVVGRVDGVETNRGTGAAALGHPLNALAWAANDLAARGRGLRNGDIVTTGACLGVVAAAPGQTVAGDYGDLGSVSASFA